MTGRVSVALVHYPCVDKAGEIYTTSVTNLDVHDIARASKTYGVGAYYIVHPVAAQKALVEEIARFWETGKGNNRNRDRKQALQLITVVATTEDAIARERALGPCTVVSTSAKPGTAMFDPKELRARIRGGENVLLVFGTGYGLADEVLALADVRLTPLQGPTDFNHLSVRAAISIYLDRLCAIDHG